MSTIHWELHWWTAQTEQLLQPIRIQQVLNENACLKSVQHPIWIQQVVNEQMNLQIRTRAHLPKSLSEQKSTDPLCTGDFFGTFITFHKLIQVASIPAVLQENILLGYTTARYDTTQHIMSQRSPAANTPDTAAAQRLFHRQWFYNLHINQQVTHTHIFHITSRIQDQLYYPISTSPTRSLPLLV